MFICYFVTTIRIVDSEFHIDNALIYSILKYENLQYDQLFTALFHICDISLKFDCFPDKIKISKIQPLFKADETGLVSNYRPISILPIFFKIARKNNITKFITM